MNYFFGNHRVYYTQGNDGDTDALMNAISEWEAEFASNPDCIAFYYGTQLMDPNKGVIDDEGVLREGDPFTVWVWEIWASETVRNETYANSRLANFDKSLEPLLAYEPDKGVKIKLRGMGKIT